MDNSRWIIAFDEFQEITKLNGENFEKLLRSCIQHHQNISYLFFGSKTHILKDMFSNKNRAFYNAAAIMSISTITELFSKKTAKDFDLGAVSSTQKAIEVFINDGIIERNQSKYDFSDPIYVNIRVSNINFGQCLIFLSI